MGRTSAAVGAALAVAWAAGPARAEVAGAGATYRLVTGEGPYSRFVLTLPAATADQQEMQIHLGCRQATFPQAWLTFGPDHLIPRSADAGGLRLDAGRLRGLVTAFNLGLTCTLDGTVKGGKVAGTFRAVWPARERGKDAPEATGPLSGEVIGEQALRRRCALAPGRDWPACRGPYGSGSAADCGAEMVAAAEDIQLLWKGQCWVPNSYSYGSPDGGNGVQGGHMGPIVAAGRVYLSYWEPSGEACDQATFDSIRTNRPDYFRARAPAALWRKRYRISADDVVLCLDAATGKLLWKAVFDDRALNIYSRSGRGGMEGRISSKASAHMMPCIRDGRLYAQGCMGYVYCLDAATGTLLWESNVGAFLKEMLEVKRRWLAQGKLGEMGTFTVSMNVIGGVLICSQRPGGRSGPQPVMGFDAATGKLLWRDGPMIHGGGVPLRWTHEGREYAICEGACVEPRTGKVCWKADIEHAKEPVSVTLHGDVLIANGTTHGKGGSFNAWRLGVRGATKLWQLDSSYYCQAHKSPVAYRGHLYAWIERTNERRFGMICVELATGKITAEQYGEPFRTGQSSALIQTDGRVIYEKALEVIQADPVDLRVLGGPVPVPWAASVTPAIADGRIFIRTGDGVVCYDLRKPGPEELARRNERKKRALAGLLTDLHGRDGVRMALAVRRMARLGSAAEEEIIAELNRALAAGDAQRFALLLAPACSGAKALREAAAGCVRKALTSDDDELYLAAVAKVGAVDLPGEAVRPALMRVLQGPRRRLWAVSAETLLRVDPGAAGGVVDALAAVARGDRTEPRNAAALLLADLARRLPHPAARKRAIAAAAPVLEEMVLFHQRRDEARAALVDLGLREPPTPTITSTLDDEPALDMP